METIIGLSVLLLAAVVGWNYRDWRASHKISVLVREAKSTSERSRLLAISNTLFDIISEPGVSTKVGMRAIMASRAAFIKATHIDKP